FSDGRHEEITIIWNVFKVNFSAAGISVLVIGVLLAGFTALPLAGAIPHVDTTGVAPLHETPPYGVTTTASTSPSGTASPATATLASPRGTPQGPAPSPPISRPTAPAPASRSPTPAPSPPASRSPTPVDLGSALLPAGVLG